MNKIRLPNVAGAGAMVACSKQFLRETMISIRAAIEYEEQMKQWQNKYPEVDARGIPIDELEAIYLKKDFEERCAIIFGRFLIAIEADKVSLNLGCSNPESEIIHDGN